VHRRNTLPTVIARAAVLVILAGCSGGHPYEITRTVGGETRTGIFVSPYSYEHFVRGELALERGDLRAAEQEYRQARAGSDDDPLLIARLAEVVDRLDREAEAIQLLEEGARLDPESEAIWLTRGHIAERHSRVEDAIEAYARAQSAAPRSELGPLALAALLRERERRDEADGVLERFLSRAHGAGAARARLALAIERGRAQDAADAVRALLDVAPARADEVRSAAQTSLRAGRPELAMRLLEALPEQDSDRPLRLEAAIAAGDRSRAEGLLATWMPDGAADTLVVAHAYLTIGDAARAIELARAAIAIDETPDARLVLGRALRAAHRAHEAARELVQIPAGSSAWVDARVELAASLRDAGLPARAAQILAHTPEIAQEPALHIALAAARREAGDIDGALAALNGTHASLLAARASLLESLGRIDEAARAWAQIVPDAPDLESNARERIRIERMWQQGNRTEAVGALRGYAERCPEDLGARARLAGMLSAVGQTNDATRVATEAAALATDPGLREHLHASRPPSGS
jgi:tetratricopeptide (TPR) repeat protein